MLSVDSEQAKLSTRIVWSTLLASQVIYLIVILVVDTNPRATPRLFPAILAVFAVCTSIASNLAWRRASGAGRPLHSQPPEVAKAFTSYMVAWVLDESIAVYGLVLGFLAASQWVWAPFSLSAFLLMLIHRPVWQHEAAA